jgi:hypothetical protein
LSELKARCGLHLLETLVREMVICKTISGAKRNIRLVWRIYVLCGGFSTRHMHSWTRCPDRLRLYCLKYFRLEILRLCTSTSGGMGRILLPSHPDRLSSSLPFLILLACAPLAVKRFTLLLFSLPYSCSVIYAICLAFFHLYPPCFPISSLNFPFQSIT